MEKPLHPAAIRACELHIAKDKEHQTLCKLNIAKEKIQATDSYTLLEVANDGAKTNGNKGFPSFDKAIPTSTEVAHVYIDVKYLWRMAESLRILAHAKRGKGDIDPHIVRIDLYGSDKSIKFTMGDDVIGIVMPICM